MYITHSVQTVSGQATRSEAKNASLEARHTLQNVFTAVLREAGREGFRSADAVEPASSLTEQVQSSWSTWFNQFGQTSYSDYLAPPSGSLPVSPKPTATEFRDAYSELLVDAVKQGAYANPLHYVRQLDQDQLRTTQLVHRLADPIDTSQLSEEGAINLLLPPPAAIDLNHDGLNAIGKAFTLGFPDSQTPREVRDAWETATADLPEDEVMHHVFQIKSATLLANVKLDGQGQVIGFLDPGDPNWRNPMDSASYSYASAAQKWLDYLDGFKSQIPPAQYERDRTFWSRFQSLLNQGQ